MTRDSESSTTFEERLHYLEERSVVIRDWIALMEHSFGKTDEALTLLSRKEAAELLGVAEPTFRKMVATDPRLPRYKVGSGLRFNKAALLNYIVEASKDWTSHMDMLEGMNL